MGKWREMTREDMSGARWPGSAGDRDENDRDADEPERGFTWRKTAADWERGDRSMEKVGANRKSVADMTVSGRGNSDHDDNNTARGLGRPKDGFGFSQPGWGEDED